MYNLAIRQNVAAGASGSYAMRFHAPGVVNKFSLRFYPGQMLALKIDARIKKLGGSYVSIFNNFDGSLEKIAGDDDYFVEDPGIEVRRGEELQLIVENTATVPEGGDESDYAYDFQCYCTVKEVKDK